MSKKHQPLHPDEPLRLPDHPRPVTRREFIRQGFIKGGTVVAGASLANLFLPPEARAAVGYFDSSLNNTGVIGTQCIGGAGGRIPFICFDLAGGANLAGSNVLVGGQGGQEALLTATGYSRMGIGAARVPNPSQTGAASFIDNRLGLKFHSESALLAGIMNRFKTLPNGVNSGVNGAVIPARSENDTGNNPHNPLYAIAKTHAQGVVTTLIGSVNSDSGGNSVSPMTSPFSIDPSIRPVKVDRPSDVTGLVGGSSTPGTGVGGILPIEDAIRIMNVSAKISKRKIDVSGVLSTADKELLNCGYVKAAYLADALGNVPPDPAADGDIVGANGIFSTTEFNADSEYRKAASVMKMVIEHNAGAGCVTMGGFDYHTGDRITGERRDFRAGECIGACLEFAARRQQRLMIYVFSDGSLFSDGTADPRAITAGFNNSIALPSGKLVWTGDSSTTACSFFLVYNPFGPVQLVGTAAEQPMHQQLGWFKSDGSVDTASSPGANNVNQLVELVTLNYLALHANGLSDFSSTFQGHHLGADLTKYTAFNPIA